jgi:hypothetical protein
MRKYFSGESYRADALTWTNGLKEFGDFGNNQLGIKNTQ